MKRLVAVVALIVGAFIVGAGFSRPLLLSAQQLPNEPFRQFGTSVTGAFEGWFAAPDGTRYFLIGYLNRNNNQSVDVPIGPNNHIDPGGPDMGQPTHFLPGRHWGMFVIKVPAEFTGPDQRLTWTIVANGQPTVIPRGGKLVILQAYELPDHPDEFDALIQAGKDSPHRPLTKKVLAGIWQRGRADAKQS